MNDRRQRFIDEYMIDFNGTRAAIAAGYIKIKAAERGIAVSITQIGKGNSSARQSEVSPSSKTLRSGSALSSINCRKTRK